MPNIQFASDPFAPKTTQKTPSIADTAAIRLFAVIGSPDMKLPVNFTTVISRIADKSNHSNQLRVANDLATTLR